VQAAGRAYGHLSFLNSEEFADVPGADIEVFSKAINAGQYPLSSWGSGSGPRDSTPSAPTGTR